MAIVAVDDSATVGDVMNAADAVLPVAESVVDCCRWCDATMVGDDAGVFVVNYVDSDAASEKHES